MLLSERYKTRIVHKFASLQVICVFHSNYGRIHYAFKKSEFKNGPFIAFRSSTPGAHSLQIFLANRTVDVEAPPRPKVRFIFWKYEAQKQGDMDIIGLAGRSGISIRESHFI